MASAMASGVRAQGAPPPAPARDSAAPRDTVPRGGRPPADTGAMARLANIRDSVAADSLARERADSVRRTALARRAADTLKAPLAPPPLPVLGEARREWTWDRDQLFAEGARTLGELLARVPGVTSFRTGYLLAPQLLAFLGDVRAVRLFLDGLEVDPLDPRSPATHDLSLYPLAALESVVAERGAGELRVHLRSWRVSKTIPETRVDIYTGSEQTNFYRGFFGRRWRNGMNVQFVGQQFSTFSRDVGGDGSMLSIMSRVGWARGRWTIEGTWNGNSPDRTQLARYVDTPAPVAAGLAGFRGSVGQAWGRVAWGSPGGRGPWVQLMAATMRHAETPASSSSSSGLGGFGGTGSTGTSTSTGTDTSIVRAQYVASAGFARWGARVEGYGRVRAGDGRTRVAPAVRVAYEKAWVTLGALVEREGPDSTGRTDLSFAVRPVRWFAVGGALARRDPGDGAPSAQFARVETAFRWRARELTVGLLQRPAGTVGGLRGLDTLWAAAGVPGGRAISVGLRGPVYRATFVDLSALRYDSVGLYRPQTEAQVGFGIRTTLPQRFPRGNFGFLLRGEWTYRSAVLFPARQTGTATARTILPSFAVPGLTMEVKIGDAVLTALLRNPLGKFYGELPGYLMPRLVNYYGIRWNFRG